MPSKIRVVGQRAGHEEFDPFPFQEGVIIMAANPITPDRRDDLRTGTMGQFATEMKPQSQEPAPSLGEKAREAASNFTDKARDVAASAAQTAGDVARNVGQRAENAASAVGGSMKSLAEGIREKSLSASTAVADTLESSGRYLEQQGFKGVASDLTDLIRRNPIPALLVGIGIGFMLARVTRS
jgi:hypothetical protein